MKDQYQQFICATVSIHEIQRNFDIQDAPNSQIGATKDAQLDTTMNADLVNITL